MIWASRLTAAGKVDGLYFAVPSRSACDRAAQAGRAHARRRASCASRPRGARGSRRDRYRRAPRLRSGTVVDRCAEAMLCGPGGGRHHRSGDAIHAPGAARLAPRGVAIRHLLVIDEVHASDPYMAA